MPESARPNSYEAWISERFNGRNPNLWTGEDLKSCWYAAQDSALAELSALRARLATATELVRDMQAMLEQLPTGIDTEADESDTSPEDMVAHIGGLMWKRLAAFLEGCR